MPDWELIFEKEIDGYLAKVYDDDWYDFLVIEKDGKVVFEKSGSDFTESDIKEVISNM